MSLIFHYHKDQQPVNDLKLEYLRNQVIKLKNTFQPIQKSKEWYEMRNGLLTASDWGYILNGQNNVLLKKCGDDSFVGGDAIDWGNKYEQVANMIYEHRNNVEVLEFGCLKHPYIDFLGASPDGITHDGVMVEIKCPYTRKITGIPKHEYWCQVQGQLEVCDLDRCDFIECCLKEYENEIEYLNDNFENDYSLNMHDGNEKGVIAEFYRKSDKTYFNKYSNIGIIGEKLDEWKKNIIKDNTDNNIIFYKFHYWKLVEVSCIPIYRNHEWFYNSKELLENYWKKILKYRELGLLQLKEDIKNGNINESCESNDNIDKKINEKKQKIPKVVKKKEDNFKKQKNMKEYIILDNNYELNIVNNDINISNSEDEDDFNEELNIDITVSLFSD